MTKHEESIKEAYKKIEKLKKALKTNNWYGYGKLITSIYNIVNELMGEGDSNTVATAEQILKEVEEIKEPLVFEYCPTFKKKKVSIVPAGISNQALKCAAERSGATISKIQYHEIIDCKIVTLIFGNDDPDIINPALEDFPLVAFDFDNEFKKHSA